MKENWYDRIRRWGQTNLTEDDPIRGNIEFWKEQWRKNGIQCVIVNCDGIVSYCRTSFMEQYKAQYLGERDTFLEYMQAAQEMGISVVARMDTNRASFDFFQKHRQWFCVDKNNNPIVKQGRCVICINSTYVSDYLIPLVQEIILKYRPASFAENSWSGLDQETICYCESCREQFRSLTGCQLPEEVDWDDEVFRKWIEWNYCKRLEAYDALNAATHASGGEDCYYIGMINADPANPMKRFVDIREHVRRTPIILTDHQSRDSMNGFEQSCVNGLLLHEAAGKSVLVPQSSAFYVRGTRTFRLSAAPASEVQKWLQSGAVGGISPWFHHVSAAQYDCRQFAHSIQFFQWHAQNENYLYDRTSLAQVGIVWSQRNTDFYGRDCRLERISLPWCGWTSTLTQERIPFVPVNVADIRRAASRLNTLILPDVAVMSDDEIDAVIDFVESGGNIILTGGTATMDEDGLYRDKKRLWDYLGLKLTGETVGSFAGQVSDWEHPDTHSYILLPEGERHTILEQFNRTELIAFGGGIHIATSTGTLEQLCGYIPPFPIFPPEFSWIREKRTDIGTIFAGTMASFSKIVYFPADIDRCYGRDRLPDHAAILASAVKWTMQDVPNIQVTGPGRLLVHSFAKNMMIIIQIVNLSCSDHMPGYVTQTYPVGPIHVTVPVECKARSVFLRVRGEGVPFTQVNGRLEFSIVVIEEQELIVIE